MILKPIVHEIQIQNQVIFLDPRIEYAKSTWIRQLHDWLGNDLNIVLLELEASIKFIRCRLPITPHSKFAI